VSKSADSARGRRGHQRLFAGGVAPFYLVILAVAILVGISAVMVISASSGEAVLKGTNAQEGISATLASFGAGVNNLLFIFAGALVAFIISRLDYRTFAPWSFPFALILIVLLIYVLIGGVTILGAQRWILIGSFSLQPSELAKPVLLVFLAYALAYFSEARKSESIVGMQATAYLGVTASVIGVSILCIIVQPDLGTTLIITFGLLIIYIMSGYSLRFLVVILPVAAGLFLFRAFALGNYQAQRIQGLVQGLFQGEYTHQVQQGLYALGSGGLFGAGLGLSRQKYFYLPEAQNDFILAVIGEEMGLMGTLLVIGALALFLWAGFTITQGARDRMGRVLAAGATTIVITQAVINLYAVIGFGPVTGKPLPFVTLGGSAMMSSFIMLGIILSVARFGGEPREGYTNHRSLFTKCTNASASFIEKRFAGTTLEKSKKSRKTRKGRTTPEGGEVDEDDIEWRWDSRARVSGARARA